jgi:hypothetical protein
VHSRKDLFLVGSSSDLQNDCRVQFVSQRISDGHVVERCIRAVTYRHQVDAIARPAPIGQVVAQVRTVHADGLPIREAAHIFPIRLLIAESANMTVSVSKGSTWNITKMRREKPPLIMHHHGGRYGVYLRGPPVGTTFVQKLVHGPSDRCRKEQLASVGVEKLHRGTIRQALGLFDKLGLFVIAGILGIVPIKVANAVGRLPVAVPAQGFHHRRFRSAVGLPGLKRRMQDQCERESRVDRRGVQIPSVP